jgi:hypothetical protein
MTPHTLPGRGVRGPGGELFGQRLALFDPAFPLAVADHMHQRDADQCALSRFERVEPQHRTHDPLHSTMTWLHAVVEGLHLADSDRSAVARSRHGGDRREASTLAKFRRFPRI